MRTRFTSYVGLVATAFLLATAVTTTADLEDLTKARVVRIKGAARYTTGTGVWQPLKVGDVVNAGTLIQTAADSRVDLVLGDPEAVAFDAKISLPFGSASPSGGGAGSGLSQADRNFIRMMENTVLSIDTLSATDAGMDIVTDTQLDLRAGRIFGAVKKLSGGSRFEIKVPNGVAGVRGTFLMLWANGNCAVWKEGGVDMALTVEEEVRSVNVGANEMYDAATNSKSSLVSNKDLSWEMSSAASASGEVRLSSTLAGPTPPLGKDEDHISGRDGNLDVRPQWGVW